ncbi:hypothetical protein PHYSODRAFT_510516 [Phytophthora sojae]|uniref:Uncharacterized protein n=1 Tax=Phytophthora sojae (strain P6497) TaxID=1094619 RepID=G4ZRX2_PHYSP|nr:hypothetical protein PHYSODRAFT_510516 [Phytophthora sojae]EGZ14009.1 hypothetical protein PHYSODRAFT_510516 [Phytophthora sojae]|eukprot:XP_009531438.1 hypothetical protein PHYSODRAFT_510516 [Phytophthora sojae]
MQKYRESTSVRRSLMILGAIPLLPLLCAAVVDAFPLESPDLGLAHSGTVWARGVLVTLFDSYSLSWMLGQYTVPAEWQTPAAVLVPVFKIIQKNVLCRLLCGQDDVKPELVTFNVDVTNALFISSTMQNLQSVKSSAMLIVVDFMQMLASLFDLRLMLNGIRDATNESTDQAIACALMVALKYPELGERPMLIKRSFPSKSDIFRSSKLSMQRKESATNYISRLSSITRVAPIQVEGNAGIVPTCPFEKRKVSPTLLSRNCTVASDSTTLALVEQMTPQQRHFLLHKVLQIMFFMEFFLLTEVLKTLIPAAYSCYLVILFHWPNRRFYPQFDGLDESGFWEVVAHIQIYGMLETILFVTLIWTLHKMTYNFPVQQLGFAVSSNWGKIQCKIVIFTVLLLQTTIPQLGTSNMYDIVFYFSRILHLCVCNL